jgi:hypothetical protein
LADVCTYREVNLVPFLRQYVDGNNHSNTVESSFSLLKRGLIGTYHHVGEQHLQRYVTEFDFRWDHRKTTDRERSDKLLTEIAGKRLTCAN